MAETLEEFFSDAKKHTSKLTALDTTISQCKKELEQLIQIREDSATNINQDGIAILEKDPNLKALLAIARKYDFEIDTDFNEVKSFELEKITDIGYHNISLYFTRNCPNRYFEDEVKYFIQRPEYKEHFMVEIYINKNGAIKKPKKNYFMRLWFPKIEVTGFFSIKLGGVPKDDDGRQSDNITIVPRGEENTQLPINIRSQLIAETIPQVLENFGEVVSFYDHVLKEARNFGEYYPEMDINMRIYIKQGKDTFRSKGFPVN
jgi:hypothetical protein